MKKSYIFFTILFPTLLIACNNQPTIKSADAKLKEPKLYYVGQTINKDDINVQGFYTGGFTKSLASNEWKCNDFNSDNVYTFTSTDVSKKTFEISIDKIVTTLVVEVAEP